MVYLHHKKSFEVDNEKFYNNDYSDSHITSLEKRVKEEIEMLGIILKNQARIDG